MCEQKINDLLDNTDVVFHKNDGNNSQGQDKINLFIFGQPHHNLLKIIFESFSIKPKNSIESFFVKACEFNILYGISEKMYQVDGKEKKEVSWNEITSMLSQFDNAINRTKFEFITNKTLSKSLNIHIIISSNDYADVDWNYVQKNADYILFSLTATALLSMCERKILRTVLLPNVGNEVGIILTNNNMILSHDKPMIDSSLAKMFGDYGSPIFRFPSDEDEDRLLSFLNDLPKQFTDLISKKHKRAKTIELNELLTEVKLQMEVLLSDNAKLDDAIELLNEKLQKLPDRKESAFRRARMKYTAKLRIELSEAVSIFHQEFKEILKTEIYSNHKVQELGMIIPGYICKQWENEAARLLEYVQSYSESIGIEVKDYINDDIISYVADGVSEDFANYVFGLTKLYMKKQPDSIEPITQVKNFDFEMVQDNSKWTKYGVVASGVALAMLSNPIVGVAVAVFGSKKISKDSEKNFVEANHSALLDASNEMCIDYHNELDVWIEQVAKHIENNLEKCIGACYQQVIDLMVDAVKSKQQDFSNHDMELGKLKQLQKKIETELH